jgi:Zn-dependent protease
MSSMASLRERAPVPLVVGWGALGPVVALGGLFAFVAARAGYSIPVAAALGGIGGTGSLLVHELGHAGAARRCVGVRPVAVRLGWLGASTHLEGRYTSGRDRLRVAVRGPMASFALATSLVAFLWYVPTPHGVKHFAAMLVLFNVIVGALNLVPVPPLDGHNAIVGLLWSRLGSEAAAMRVVRRIELTIAVVEVPAAIALTVEDPMLGLTVLSVIVALFGQRLLTSRRPR